MSRLNQLNEEVSAKIERIGEVNMCTLPVKMSCPIDLCEDCIFAYTDRIILQDLTRILDE